jgi:hypothetical protein
MDGAFADGHRRGRVEAQRRQRLAALWVRNIDGFEFDLTGRKKLLEKQATASAGSPEHPDGLGHGNAPFGRCRSLAQRAGRYQTRQPHSAWQPRLMQTLEQVLASCLGHRQIRSSAEFRLGSVDN